MWITWKHETQDFPAQLSFEDKVEIFYEQTLGWHLHIADLVANGGTTFGEFKAGKPGYTVRPIRHSGFAVVHLCLSYLELVGSLESPKPLRPTKAFIAGVKSMPALIDVATVSNRALSKLYDRARCGLYHEGRTRAGVGLGFPPDGRPMAYHSSNDLFNVNPERLPPVLKAHLAQLRTRLLDPTNTSLRQRFEQRFDAGFDSENPTGPWWREILRWFSQHFRRAV